MGGHETETKLTVAEKPPSKIRTELEIVLLALAFAAGTAGGSYLHNGIETITPNRTTQLITTLVILSSTIIGGILNYQRYKRLNIKWQTSSIEFDKRDSIELFIRKIIASTLIGFAGTIILLRTDTHTYCNY